VDAQARAVADVTVAFWDAELKGRTNSLVLLRERATAGRVARLESR
jgi:hypothetical protein